MTEQMWDWQKGSVSILHPQWELRPAGCVASPPPPPSVIMFLQQVNVALCGQEATLHSAQVALVGRPLGDKQLAQHRRRHTGFYLSYAALDLGTHTHTEKNTHRYWLSCREKVQKKASPCWCLLTQCLQVQSMCVSLCFCEFICMCTWTWQRHGYLWSGLLIFVTYDWAVFWCLWFRFWLQWSYILLLKGSVD